MWTVLYDQIGEAKIEITFRTAEVLTWAKDKRLKAWGQWFQFFVPEGLEGFSLRYFTNVLEWPYEEAQLYLVNMREAPNDPSIHFSQQIVCGHKLS
ncbi:hypothetical protein VUR80DRAFT_5108 [Thermomyces stellatus]